MAEFFKIFGIFVCALLVDVLAFGFLLLIKVWDIDDDAAFLLPAIVNGVGFAICAAFLISRLIS